MSPVGAVNGNMILIPKDCDQRSKGLCELYDDKCKMEGGQCINNVWSQFEDPTKKKHKFPKYPDYNPSCKTNGGDVLQYYKNGHSTGNCSFVTNTQDQSIKLIPEQGYKRRNMNDCTASSENNANYPVQYFNKANKHIHNKWNPMVDGGKPLCNAVSDSGFSSTGKNGVKNPFVPIRYYDDEPRYNGHSDGGKGKFYIREPFVGKSIYWNPSKNTTEIL